MSFAVWLTGLPGSGKSAIARGLLHVLHSRGVEASVLESDVMRTQLTPHARYDDAERDFFYAALADMAAALVGRGRVVLIDATANLRRYRDAARGRIGRFCEVYVDTPLEVCRARDPKGLYRAGGNLPGVQAPYEPPASPELVVPGDHGTPGEGARRIVDALAARGIRPRVLHASNSAGLLAHPDARFDLVRCGIAIYGMDPFHSDAAAHGLEPALRLSSWVAAVKPIARGESAGYGRRFVAQAPTRIATVPIGYADGVRRGLTNNADVLVGGRRRPLAGTVSMDNVTLDLGPDAGVAIGDEAVLIGEQGGERILAEEWARRLDTINYEVTCGISARVPRAYA